LCVFEDDQVMGILDIKPAAKGHVLLFPKRHYPVLPLVPVETLERLFKDVAFVIRGMKRGIPCAAVTIISPNGAAAGQQSPHLLIHLIPRDRGDRLFDLDLPEGGATPEAVAANEALAPLLGKRVSAILNGYLSSSGKTDLLLAPPATAASPTPLEKGSSQAQEATATPLASSMNASKPAVTMARSSEQATHDDEARLERLVQLISENDDLKEALLERPEEVKAAVEKLEKWKEIFKGIDIDALSNNLRIMAAAEAKRKGTVPAMKRPEAAERPYGDQAQGKPDLDAIGRMVDKKKEDAP
jgi:histidine triad (HIT) family protein